MGKFIQYLSPFFLSDNNDTDYNFQEIDFAVSLDFDFEVLPDLIELIEPYFNIHDFSNLIFQLTGPEEKNKVVEWNDPIENICCTAYLGEEIRNKNENYIPFVVQKFY